MWMVCRSCAANHAHLANQEILKAISEGDLVVWGEVSIYRPALGIRCRIAHAWAPCGR